MLPALVFQLASLLASLAMVPLLLGYLGASDYLLWTIFITMGGLTLQLESAIQTLMVRRMAPAWALGEPASFRAEERRARRAYAALSFAILLLLLPGGWLYLASMSGETAHPADLALATAWLAFTFAYAINYLFGNNNVLLLATARTDRFYWISAASRVVNIALTAAALVIGFGLVGVSVSFLASVLANVGAIAFAAATARRTLWQTGRAVAGTGTAPTAGADRRPADDAGLLRYTLFTLVGFLLYRGAFLLAAKHLPTAEAAGYGLALQAFAILYAVAIIPATVWLHRIVDAVQADSTADEDREIARGGLFAAAAIVGGTLGLEVMGPMLLDMIGSEVALPDGPILILMGLAFLVEALIMVCVNPLLVRGELGFIRAYVLLAGAALFGAAIALWQGVPPILALLVLPAIVQSVLTLPLVASRLAHARGGDLPGLLRRLARAFLHDLGRAR